MKTTKFEIIKMIVEGEENFPNAFNPLFLKAIAVGAKEVYNAQVNVTHVKPIIDSASYLISQIENIDIKLMLMEAPKPMSDKLFAEYESLIRQKRQFIESLTNVLNKL